MDGDRIVKPDFGLGRFWASANDAEHGNGYKMTHWKPEPDDLPIGFSARASDFEVWDFAHPRNEEAPEYRVLLDSNGHGITIRAVKRVNPYPSLNLQKESIIVFDGRVMAQFFTPPGDFTTYLLVRVASRESLLGQDDYFERVTTYGTDIRFDGEVLYTTDADTDPKLVANLLIFNPNTPEEVTLDVSAHAVQVGRIPAKQIIHSEVIFAPVPYFLAGATYDLEWKRNRLVTGSKATDLGDLAMLTVPREIKPLERAALEEIIASPLEWAGLLAFPEQRRRLVSYNPRHS